MGIRDYLQALKNPAKAQDIVRKHNPELLVKTLVSQIKKKPDEGSFTILEEGFKTQIKYDSKLGLVERHGEILSDDLVWTPIEIHSLVEKVKRFPLEQKA